MKPAHVQLDFFLARLCCAPHTSSISLHVVCGADPGIPDGGDHAQQFRCVVLPAVQRNLHRITFLCLNCADSLFPDIFAALMQPAPMLEDLYLGARSRAVPVDESDLTVSSLPGTFLGGHAPNLKTVYLEGITLPTAASWPIAAFRNVEFLRFGAERERVLPDVLAMHFPALQHLDIMVFAFLDSEAATRAAFVCRPPSTLDVLVKNGDCGPLFSAFHPSDLSAITHLTCSAHSALGWIPTLLRSLEGPLTLTIRDIGTPGRDVYIELSSESSDSATGSALGRIRRFHLNQVYAQHDDVEVWWQVQKELFSPALLARISSFRLLSHNAVIVPTIGRELPACETLELGFDGLGCYNHPLVTGLGSENRTRLQFPVVRTVMCTAADSLVAVAAEDLCDLLAEVIQYRPSPVEVIEFSGVQLTGDIAVLEREFGCEVRYRDL